MNKAPFVSLLLLFVSACADHEVEKPYAEEQYVVNAICTPGSEIKLELSKTFSDPGSFFWPAEKQAEIYLKENGQRIDTLRHDSVRYFVSHQNVKQNTHLEVSIKTRDGKLLSASTAIPRVISLSLLSLDSNITAGKSTYNYEIELKGNNSGETTLYIWYRGFIADTLNGDAPEKDIPVALDKQFAGSPLITVPGDYEGKFHLSASRKVVHRFAVMSKELYLYYRAQDKFLGEGKDYGVDIPPVTPTNIEGGVGFFSYYQEFEVK